VAMALPQTLGFKAEAVNEEGIWCAYTVVEVARQQLCDCFV